MRASHTTGAEDAAEEERNTDAVAKEGEEVAEEEGDMVPTAEVRGPAWSESSQGSSLVRMTHV